MRQPDDADVRALFESVHPDIAPTSGSRERLERKLREAIRAREIGPSPEAGWWLARRWLLRGGLAAAAMVAIAAACWWLVAGGVSKASADFAEMLQQVRQARTVAYRVILRVPGRPEDKAEVLMAGQGDARVTWADGRMHIYRSGSSKCLSLTPGSKRAWLHESSGVLLFDEPLQVLRRATDPDGELVGKEMLGGREVAVYRIQQARGEVRVWVDPRDNLPLRIEVGSAGDAGQVTMVLEDFGWNLAIPESVFRIEIPPGYALVQPEAEPSEEALVEALRGCAERSGGLFPASFDRSAVVNLILKAIQTDTIGVMPEPDEAGKRFYRTCLSGLAFVDHVKANGSWRYVGRGVRLGEGSRPLCWWQTAEGGAFQVVYGDLMVCDVPPGQLPDPRRAKEQ